MKVFQIPYRKDNFFGFLFLLVLVVPFAFSFFLFESFEILKLGLLGLFLFLAFFAWALQKKIDHKEKKWHGSRLFLFFLLAFAFWCLLSTVFAWDKNLAFFGFYPRFTNGFVFLALWILLILAFGLLSWEKRKSLLKLLAVSGGIVALWGLLQSAGLGYYEGVSSEFFIRAPSFLGNPNFAAMYVSALLPLQAVFFSMAKKFYAKVFFGLSLFVGIWSVIVLTSRGALFAMLVALCAGLAISAIRRQRKLAGIFLGGLFFAFLLFVVFWNLSRPGSVQSTVSLKEHNIQQRFAVWQLSADAIHKRPILGAGLSNFPLIFERERTSAGILNIGFYDDPHNLILMLAATGGIPLAVFFLGLLGAGAFAGFKNLVWTGDLEILGSLAGVSAWVIGSMFNPVAIPCYIALALFLSSMFGESGRTLPEFFESSKTRAAIVIFSILAVLLSGVFLVSEHLFGAGMRHYKLAQFSEANKKFQAANKLNPFIFLHGLYAAGGSVLSGQKTENSLKTITKASEINPSWSINTSGMANVYYLLFWKTNDAKYIPIIKAYVQKSLSLNPFSQYNNFMAAQFEYAFGDIEQALVYAKRTLVLYQDNPKFWLLLGKLYQETGKREQMLYALEQAQKKAPETQPQFKWLWEAALKEKDVKKFNFSVKLGLGGLE